MLFICYSFHSFNIESIQEKIMNSVGNDNMNILTLPSLFFSFFHSNIIRFQSCEQLDLNAYFSSTRWDSDDLIEPQDFKLPLLSCVEMKLLNSVKWRSSPLVWLKSCWFANEYIILFPIISIYWLLDSWCWSSTSNISSMRRFGD